MRQSNNKILVLSTLWLACSVPAAHAGEAGWYADLSGAAAQVSDSDTSSAGGSGSAGCQFELPPAGCLVPGGGGASPATSGKLSYEDGTSFGLALGRQFRNGLRTELAYATLDSDTDRIALNNGSSAAVNGQIDVESLLLNAWYDIDLGSALLPYLGAGVATRNVQLSSDSGIAKDRVFGWNLGAGLGWKLAPRWTANLDYRYLSGKDPKFSDNSGESSSSGFEAQTLGLSLRWLFVRIPPPDADGDGVTDALDRCPNTPAGATVDGQGCALDSDDDGVIDLYDKCPKTPRNTPVNKQGCVLDSDGDGVPDYKDKCPGTAAGIAVNASGCALDTDRDGIINPRDECPDTPAGTKVMSNGCAAGQSIVLRGVNFEFDAARLTAQAKRILREAVDLLKGSPDFSVEIQGHTDDKGSEIYNLRLAQARAESVRNFLIEQGISAARLQARGYGENQPKMQGQTEAARSVNRRVELLVLE